MFLDSSIVSLPKTSGVTLARLKKLNIANYYDLINYFPYKYDDFSYFSPVSQLYPGKIVTIKGEVIKMQNVYTRSHLRIQKAQLTDQTGFVDLVWFNQPYLFRIIKPKQLISISGMVEQNYGRFSIKPLAYEFLTSLSQDTIHTGRLVPVYSEKKGISSKTIREKMYYVWLQSETFSEIQEFLPKKIIEYNKLISESIAYKNIHFPSSPAEINKAKERLAFDELFIILLAASELKKKWKKENVTQPIKTDKKNLTKLDHFLNNLSFSLTASQKKRLAEIVKDLSKKQPMNRLLQGDVGSGKTVLAAAAAYLSWLNNLSTLIMAPTEILAQQHYLSLKELFKNKVEVALITGSRKSDLTKTDNPKIIVGTQALIQKKLKFKKIGLVVIDEQHRFGVKQRGLLKEKGSNTHFLTMTATPIPRTVALTFYGELDISYLDELPKGRIPIKSFLVPMHKRMAGYHWLKKQIKSQKIQAFIVCPLIEESLIETNKSVKAVKKEFTYLTKEIFPDISVGLLHGRMKSTEKEKIMNEFKNHKIDILVTTSVVEVGIDIPNAAVIIIEAAERYGLAQLHQLRGRVGRGKKQSYCLIYTENEGQETNQRLNFFVKHHSGNELAQYDLENRGAGEIFGTKQHGLSRLKIAEISNYALVKKIQNAVKYFVDNYQLKDFSEIKKRLNQYQLTQITKD